MGNLLGIWPAILVIVDGIVSHTELDGHIPNFLVVVTAIEPLLAK